MKPREQSIPTFESRSFAVEITGTDGDHRIRVLAAPYYRTFLNTHFKVGEKATLVITDKKPKRTDAQNNLYWLYLSEIAKETGHSSDDLHEYFKQKCLPRTAVEVYGESVLREPSTTKLNRTQFGDYIREIEALTGILCPDTEGYVRGI